MDVYPYILKEYIVSTVKAYEEFIDFIAAGTSPQSVITFRPSNAIKKMVADLINKEKTIGLSSDEKSELEHYMQLEHIMRLAKVHARQHLLTQ
jgi:hypothetical protein